ncbi:hypothetical protein GCM10010168_61120 [Actinoplanes ianthinogenes]|uniref:Ternary complex associated domain-containing protein n=1 Tax=Actinoplanes ianthinogenes TaxID=122358 RepID=A0ABM7M4L6_9ACTN|nr:phosphotransferase [Actinoplanes ianthinogenes]BCJ46473.1 hypothetical protein Aiant_71300 [Actinoplanes ianthinogenes]GGR34491.1 hypothetical protein GCM10010168_61120 [Actinoplanes ianthinogenes]
MPILETPHAPDAPGTYLLHCRPQVVFHLGHLRMLNVLYQLLTNGNTVIILLITYDEHDPNNRTMKRRLAEDTELTKEFYKAYLGFSHPNLRIVTTAEIPSDEAAIRRIQKNYAALYAEGNSAVRYLVDKHARPWSSPNILFVPKCIQAIEALAPDALIAGAKHRPIADCFDAILEREGRGTTSYLFDHFYDLSMATAMDHVRSVQNYIDVSDHEDLVLHKLNLLSEQVDRRSTWVSHFFDMIFVPAPERIKTGIPAVHSYESARVLALTKFLANVRHLIPYAPAEKDQVVDINWSDAMFRQLGPEEQSDVERIATSLYVGQTYRSIAIHKIMKGGKSGSRVFGVREFEDENAARIANVSVLKVGPAEHILAERRNYQRFIEPRRTGAFMAVRSSDAIIGNQAGIVYDDAGRFLGIEPTGQLEPLTALFTPGLLGLERIREVLDDLYSRHLHEVLYKHGVRRDVAQIRRPLNEFLPADFRVLVGTVDRRPVGEHPSAPVLGSDDVLRVGIRVTETDLVRSFCRGYTLSTHQKIDLDLSELGERQLNVIAVDAELVVTGVVQETRDSWFRRTLGEIGLNYADGKLVFSPGNAIEDPVARLDRVLDREYRNVVMSAIHGDLHAGNVLWGSEKYGIIDYGKMRQDWPALYDAAFLAADVQSAVTAGRLSLAGVHAVEQLLAFGTQKGDVLVADDLQSILDLFQYENQCVEVRDLGPRDLYYALVAAVLLGRLKFDLPRQEKRMSVALADWFLRRVA